MEIFELICAAVALAGIIWLAYRNTRLEQELDDYRTGKKRALR